MAATGTDWIGTVKSTSPNYVKGASDLTLRGRLILRLLQQKGRIKYNQTGRLLVWDVEAAEHDVETASEGTVVNYSRHDPLEQYEIDWRGYRTTDLCTREERYKNRGPGMMVNRYKTIMKRMRKSLQNNFCGELYVDGSTAANSERIHGIRTMMGVGSWAATDRLVDPDGTYGGLTTDVGDYGGSWSSDLTTYPNATIATDWPDGSGDSHYDFNTPKIVAVNSTAWDTDSATDFTSNCVKVLRQAKIWVTRCGGEEGAPDLCTLGSDWFYQFKNAHDPKLQIWVPSKRGADLGFSDVLNFEGMDIQTDFDCPASNGFIWNASKMDVRSMAKDLFYYEGPTYDPHTDSYLYLMGFIGNCTFEPKYFAHILNATAA